MPGRCPVCHEKLDITRLHCPRCETTIEGRFEGTKFDALTRDQLDFVEVFLKARGNIKEVERELGISYPTVRGRLEAVIQGLGYRPEPVPEDTGAAARRREVLEALKTGRISAEDAVKLLKSKAPMPEPPEPPEPPERLEPPDVPERPGKGRGRATDDERSGRD
ncbi:MAG: DUF2089 family protein [Bacillota bacterium]